MKLKIEKEEYINKTFRLSKKLIAEIEKVCKENGISLNKFVDICARYALSNLEKDDENN